MYSIPLHNPMSGAHYGFMNLRSRNVAPGAPLTVYQSIVQLSPTEYYEGQPKGIVVSVDTTQLKNPNHVTGPVLNILIQLPPEMRSPSLASLVLAEEVPPVTVTYSTPAPTAEPEASLHRTESEIGCNGNGTKETEPTPRRRTKSAEQLTTPTPAPLDRKNSPEEFSKEKLDEEYVVPYIPKYLRPCGYCMSMKQPEHLYNSHSVVDKEGRVTCPILQAKVCPLCKATGIKSHTISFCPKFRNSKLQNWMAKRSKARGTKSSPGYLNNRKNKPTIVDSNDDMDYSADSTYQPLKKI